MKKLLLLIPILFIFGLSQSQSINTSPCTIPTVYLSGASQLCKGSSTIITATGGTQYQWSTGATTSSIHVSPTMSITYTVQVANPPCFKDTTFTVIVDTMPKVQFSGDTSICVGDSTTIYVTPGYTYAWTNGSTADSIFRTYSSPGLYKYYITVTNGACSIDSNSITVRVHTCTGIQSYSDPERIDIFPNPGNGVFTLLLANSMGKTQMEIYNILGEKIYNSVVNAGTNQINLSNEPEGLYLYRILTENGELISTGKIIIR